MGVTGETDHVREPQYTRAGMVLKLQGTVELEVVVKADGDVGHSDSVRAIQASLDLQGLGGSR